MNKRTGRVAAMVIIGLTLASCTRYTCEDFKTGEYRYADENFEDVKVIRTETEQTEYSQRNGKDVEDVYSIIWDGPCSHNLVFKSTNSEVDQFHTKYDTIRVRIVEITDKGYIFETFLNGKNPSGELIKVN